MSQRKIIYGFHYRRLQNLTIKDEPIAVPLKRSELEAIGIPQRKLERVQEEIARLALQDSSLLDRELLLNLASHIASTLL